MNYLLAKSLREAGFPNKELQMTSDDWLKKYGIDIGLSELIEACGDEFETLERERNKFKENIGWIASTKYLFGGGETREIAVANLWLALNKKQEEKYPGKYTVC